MSKLIDIFTGEWTVSTTVLALIVAQLALAIIALIVFLILMLRKYVLSSRKQGILVARKTETRQRNLVGIALDLSAVKRNYKLGESFDGSGLLVTANYDAEPLSEQVTDFTVEAPLMSWEGSPSVAVHYGDQTAYYTIDIVAEAERFPVGLELDASKVRTEFAVGEPFDYVGLNVFLHYNLEPFSEEVFSYTIDVPSMDDAGEKQVYIRYAGFMEYYTISVVEPEPEIIPEPIPEPTPEPVPEPTAEPTPEPVDEASGAVRYDRSFTARLIQSDDDVKHWYTLIKNDLLSYRKVKERISWKRETFKVNGSVVAKISYRGNTLCLSLALDPTSFDNARYKVEDVSATGSLADTPSMYRIKSALRVKRASELIAMMMQNLGIEKTDRLSEDYYLPYEGTVQLINKGLVKRMLVTVQDYNDLSRPAVESEAAATVVSEEGASVIVRVDQPSLPADVVVIEDDVESGTLRYDRSFQARIIQADDQTKQYYSAIKNELLSYGKVKDRMSWKRETYKANGSVVAKINFHGNTMCLYLPLNAADYEGTTYKVEDASANSSFSDTPCMFRIKNDKRLRMALELIAHVMEQRGISHNKREPVDYYEPYRDTVTLITEGLVRRKIKSKEEEESLFSMGKTGGENA